MRIVFIGASGHGKVCAEVAKMGGYDEILFLDDNRKRNQCGSYQVVGAEADFCKYVEHSTEFFVSIGDATTRRRIQEHIKGLGGNLATLVHFGSTISKDAKVGAGSIIMAGAVVNPGAAIGDGVIVNTSSSIDHDCIVESYSHIAVGAHLCGGVKVGSGSWVGAGVVVNNNIQICSGCIIGAGAVVVKNIDVAGTYIGVPARKKE